MADVEVVFTKYDGSLHWHFRLARLGEDEHGVWLAAPPGTVLQRGDEPPRSVPDGFVGLVPHGAMWTPLWNVRRDPEIYIDVITPPLWTGNTVTMVDLDLDVVRDRDGTVAVLDEDEFAEHQVRFGYPADLVERAQATADHLVDALTNRTEPFGTRGEEWLRRLTRLAG